MENDSIPSPQYAHLSREQLEDLIAKHRNALAATDEYLRLLRAQREAELK